MRPRSDTPPPASLYSLARAIFAACVAIPVILGGGGLPVGQVQAQTPSETRASPGITVMHKAPRPQDLPPPGARMKLSFQLSNSREITHRVNALVTLDGRLLNIIGDDGYLNEYDNPTFEIVTNSPIAEIAYQLVVRATDGSLIVSPRYTVRRACVPTLDLTPDRIPREVQGNARLTTLVEKTRALEREMAYYESALRDVSELKELLENE